jgi:hypothetical protein
MQGVSAEGCNMHLAGVLEEDDVSRSRRLQQTVANLFRDHPLEENYVEDVFAIVRLFTPTYASSCPIEV